MNKGCKNRDVLMGDTIVGETKGADEVRGIGHLWRVGRCEGFARSK